MFNHNFKKKFGQNFLINTQDVLDLIYCSNIDSSSNILEIGPGHGAITEFLLENSNHVTSIEIDNEIVAFLAEKYTGRSDFTLIHQDIIKFSEQEYFNNKPYIVVGSLPYNISKEIIKKFLTSDNPPLSLNLIIQKEVALSYATTAPKASFLHNFVRLFSNVKLLKVIPKEHFYPQPAVDGAIIKFDNIKQKSNEYLNIIAFIKKGYASPRKTLAKNLSNVGINKDNVIATLQNMNLSSTARPAELTLDDWFKLFQKYG